MLRNLYRIHQSRRFDYGNCHVIIRVCYRKWQDLRLLTAYRLKMQLYIIKIIRSRFESSDLSLYVKNCDQIDHYCYYIHKGIV